MSPRTSELLKNFAIAGGAAGAGIGVGTSLANYLSYLKNKADLQKKDSENSDDILYVDVPRTKMAGDGLSSWPCVGGGLAIAGGAVSMIAANALVRAAYNKIKKKSLQKDLADAQDMYWNAEGFPGLGKQASIAPATGKPMSGLELVSGTPVATTLLAALASGMITNKALATYFPSQRSEINDIKANKPKQVKIRFKDVDPETAAMQKSSSDKELASAMDFVVATISGGLSKNASYVPDLISTAAQGNLDAFLDNLHTLGPVSALELVKGASSEDIDPDDKYLAICLLNRNPETAPIMATLIGSEISDRLPYFDKVASEAPKDEIEVIVKLAAAMADDVAEGVIDRKTDKDDPDEESGEKKKGYQLLSSVLERNKEDKSKNKKEDDAVDKALAGE